MILPQLIQTFRNHDDTPSSLLERCLQRIELREPEVGAWVSVDADGARQQAAASTARWTAGKPLSGIDGIPVAVKDIIDIAGQDTGLGVEGWPTQAADKDAEIVKRLRDLGAVIVGKTVTTAFACFDPPKTRHPQRSHCTPGGSSSGSAAAVADRHVVWALGSQTGGSIARPAAYCGIVGFKPSHGHWSLAGVFPISHHLDHLGFLCGDPVSARDIFESVTALSVDVPSAPRLCDLSQWYESRADSSITAAHQRALERCRQAGSTVQDDAPLACDFNTVLSVHRLIMARSAAETHAAWFDERRDLYPPRVRELIEEGRSISDDHWREALEQQRTWKVQVDDWFEEVGYDAIVMPSTPTTAPCDLTTTGDPAFNSPWSLLGLPTLTVPVGRASDGLPAGIQLIGRRGCDGELVGLGVFCQQAGVFQRARQ